MSIRISIISACWALCVSCPAWAVDYSVAPLAEAPPKDELSAEIAGVLAEKGVRVTRGASTVFCDFWLCQSLPTVANFKPTAEVLYPFTPGQLIGVAKFARKGSDFRDQDIEAGVYTVRFAQQPVDGAHVGTSPTRDFLLLSKVEADKSTGVLDVKVLTEQSAEAAGSSHPALLCLQPVPKDATEFPSIRHDEERDWWIVTVKADTKQGDAAASLPIGIVVVGVAPEQ